MNLWTKDYAGHNRYEAEAELDREWEEILGEDKLQIKDK